MKQAVNSDHGNSPAGQLEYEIKISFHVPGWLLSGSVGRKLKDSKPSTHQMLEELEHSYRNNTSRAWLQCPSCCMLICPTLSLSSKRSTDHSFQWATSHCIFVKLLNVSDNNIQSYSWLGTGLTAQKPEQEAKKPKQNLPTPPPLQSFPKATPAQTCIFWSETLGQYCRAFEVLFFSQAINFHLHFYTSVTQIAFWPLRQFS